MMIFSALINNITLIVALSILYRFIIRRWEYGSQAGQAVSGLLFGAVAVIGMLNPLIFSPGLIFDGRSIVIGIAGFMGGWVTASIAALIAIAYRIWLGGPGGIMGVSVIASSAAVGVAYHYLRRRRPNLVAPIHLIGFGIIVHLCMLALTMTLPSGIRYEVFSKIAIPVIILYPLGTLLVCVVLLADEEKRRSREATERLAGEMAILAEIGRAVGSTLDIHQVYDRVAAEAGRLIPYDRFLVHLKKTDSQVMTAYVSGMDNPKRRVGELYPIQGTTTGVVMSTRAGILIQPTVGEEIKELYPNLYDTFKMGLRSTMSVPLISMDEVIGTMNFRSKRLKAYNEQDLRLAEKIGMQVAGAIVNAQLFNDLKKTEKSLRESNELFSLYIGHSPIYTYIKEVTPARSIVLQASDNFWQMIGIPGCKMAGKSMEELFPPEFAAKITADDWTVVSRGGVLELDEELNGRSYTTIKFPIVEGDRTLLAGYTIDITERKRADLEKAKLQGQLLQSQKMESVGRLAGGVAHDFNNMLGVILGHAEMALEQIDPAQKLHAHVEEIRKAAERSSDLTRQLLAFARKQTVSPKVLDMNETVAGMLKMLQRLIGEDIHLAWLPGANLWPVRMDPSQIDQILANLCVNARDAIAGVGKITIETENVSVDEDQCKDQVDCVPGDYVRLAVNDDGSGMDKEVLGKLFEPFFTTKKTGKGTGLGLATVYGIVKQNNGFINVHSEPDQGTTFLIYLPRQIGETERTETEVRQEPAMRGGETLMVVEDEPALLQLSELMLARQGYRVLTAGTPAEAIRLANKHAGQIHLLITDVVMPEMNGRDLAQKLLSGCPNMKCLFMSGYTANVIVHHGVLEAGVSFLQKPFSRKELAAKVREVLDQKRADGPP